MNHLPLAGAGALLLSGGMACADPHGMFFAVSNVVSPDNPSATIDLWTYFQPDFYAFAGSSFDVIAASDPGGFENPATFLNSPGQKAGMIAPDGDSLIDAFTGQIQFPDANIFADRANPILHWRVTWTTDDFTPRRVELATVTDYYSLYLDVWGSSIKVLDDSFTEAYGMINIVPAPAAGTPMLGAAFAFRRRRGA